MHHYQSLFQNFDLNVAQLLLTAEDFEENGRSQRVSDTLERLLQVQNIVPIINENDSVAVEELSVGDNDMLSARVAGLLGAKRLILLTSVDGLMPPEGDEIVELVEDINEVLSFARNDSGKFSIGGMKSKLQAVKYAVEHGTETIIANGRNPQNILELMKGKGKGTRFISQ
jgi:glutamate 5-kinase